MTTVVSPCSRSTTTTDHRTSATTSCSGVDAAGALEALNDLDVLLLDALLLTHPIDRHRRILRRIVPRATGPRHAPVSFSGVSLFDGDEAVEQVFIALVDGLDFLLVFTRTTFDSDSQPQEAPSIVVRCPETHQKHTPSPRREKELLNNPRKWSLSPLLLLHSKKYVSSWQILKQEQLEKYQLRETPDEPSRIMWEQALGFSNFYTNDDLAPVQSSSSGRTRTNRNRSSAHYPIARLLLFVMSCDQSMCCFAGRVEVDVVDAPPVEAGPPRPPVATSTCCSWARSASSTRAFSLAFSSRAFSNSRSSSLSSSSGSAPPGSSLLRGPRAAAAGAPDRPVPAPPDRIIV
eukprot:CAMPEP_0178982396 /NCGR_PEP_ID=MMETSP0795-20121207/475_1 /TAXON_ID=88552 /ORGANISM="Amoebophrya sp., Strain Ameob2" /LENGTH=346 /DNA_ID=CAMNT_0020673041 /DNA_START=634 /DNA_END=1677 /DNA_ORIENTATION=+